MVFGVFLKSCCMFFWGGIGKSTQKGVVVLPVLSVFSCFQGCLKVCSLFLFYIFDPMEGLLWNIQSVLL